ncbi:hypothetical protein DL96DRAFT_1605863 [Flagelloscypha sp. PMI_526]|nr:hypothetical protein DL96DRAFT_1605863 [Flagelloscypha sp. PMI_526]
MAPIRPGGGPIRRTFQTLFAALKAAVGRLDKSLDPKDTLEKLRRHKYSLADVVHIFHLALVILWFSIMQVPGFPLKLAIPFVWAIVLAIPLTSQFFFPATPIFLYLLTFYSSRFIPEAWRPSISVALLPTLETVLYGANISDILTRYTSPVLDIIAWIPYGVGHFTAPFIVAAFLWLFRPKEALRLWARTFGYMMLCGVVIQILVPCAAPWYELVHGITPANYSMKGSPGGLARIDALFHSSGYTTSFSNAPVVFGAFPSLHAGVATLCGFFISHFFPHTTRYMWGYVSVLYWATMYLTHHYLIDVVAGACLATVFFYFFLPNEFRGPAATSPPGTNIYALALQRLPPQRHGHRSKYSLYDIEIPQSQRNRAVSDASDYDPSISSQASDEEEDITYRHRHTASIASLIRGEERGPDDGWSPVTPSFPPEEMKPR